MLICCVLIAFFAIQFTLKAIEPSVLAMETDVIKSEIVNVTDDIESISQPEQSARLEYYQNEPENIAGQISQDDNQETRLSVTGEEDLSASTRQNLVDVVTYVPRSNSDMEKNGGKVAGDSSIEAHKDSGCNVKVYGATASSVLKFNGTTVGSLKTAISGGYQWSVSGAEFTTAYNATSGNEYVEVESTNCNSGVVLYLSTDNNYWNNQQ